MNRLASLTKSAIATTLAFAGIAWHVTASAEPTASWEQARVTGIAENLAKAVDALYDLEYKAPQAFTSGFAGGGNAHHEFMDRLRRLRHETRHLASSLEKGASAQATRGSVRHIKELNDDLARYGRMIEFVNPVLNQFAAFEDLFRQLTPYYGLEAKR